MRSGAVRNCRTIEGVAQNCPLWLDTICAGVLKFDYMNAFYLIRCRYFSSMLYNSTRDTHSTAVVSPFTLVIYLLLIACNPYVSAEEPTEIHEIKPDLPADSSAAFRWQQFIGISTSGLNPPNTVLPLCVGDRVFVVRPQRSHSRLETLLAYDKHTGELLLEVPNAEIYEGAVEQLLPTQTGEVTLARPTSFENIDPQTGDLLSHAVRGRGKVISRGDFFTRLRELSTSANSVSYFLADYGAQNWRKFYTRNYGTGSKVRAFPATAARLHADTTIAAFGVFAAYQIDGTGTYELVAQHVEQQAEHWRIVLATFNDYELHFEPELELAAPVVHGDQVYYHDKHALYAYSLSDGSIRWRYRPGVPSTNLLAMFVGPHSPVLLDDTGYIYGINPVTGNRQWTTQYPQGVRLDQVRAIGDYLFLPGLQLTVINIYDGTVAGVFDISTPASDDYTYTFDPESNQVYVLRKMTLYCIPLS